MTGPSTHLARDMNNRMIAGVCSGIGRRFGWRVGRVRLLFVVSCLLPGPQVLVYIALWLLMPQD